MVIVIIGRNAVFDSTMRAIVQATSCTDYYREPTLDIQERVYEINNYRDVMNERLYDIIDFFDDIQDNILPKVKPLFNQVHNKRPFNNPIAGRCY